MTLYLGLGVLDLSCQLFDDVVQLTDLLLGVMHHCFPVFVHFGLHFLTLRIAEILMNVTSYPLGTSLMTVQFV